MRGMLFKGFSFCLLFVVIIVCFVFSVNMDRCIQKEDWNSGKPSKYTWNIPTFQRICEFINAPALLELLLISGTVKPHP